VFLSHSIELTILRDISENIDEFLFAPVVEFTSQTPQVFFALLAGGVPSTLVVEEGLAVLELV